MGYAVARRIVSLGRLGTALAFATGMLAATAAPEDEAADAALEVYRVDPELTSAQFAVRHMGLSVQRGHFGRSIDAFLRGADMFDTAHYPVVRFRSTGLTFDSSRLVAVAGELTMHNVTRPVALHVARLDCGKDPDSGLDGCGAEVDTVIKRSDFGMKYAMGIVGDDIGLTFQVTAFRVPRDGDSDSP